MTLHYITKRKATTCDSKDALTLALAKISLAAKVEHLVQFKPALMKLHSEVWSSNREQLPKLTHKLKIDLQRLVLVCGNGFHTLESVVKFQKLL